MLFEAPQFHTYTANATYVRHLSSRQAAGSLLFRYKDKLPNQRRILPLPASSSSGLLPLQHSICLAGAGPIRTRIDQPFLLFVTYSEVSLCVTL